MEENLYETIAQLADSMEDRLIACRRDLHRHPEAGWFEVRTSSLVARRLTELGYEVLTGEQVCREEARMGVPERELLEKEYQRALSQGADPEFAEKARFGRTGVIGILRCGPGPVVAMRFDMDALGVTEDSSVSHRPTRERFSSVNPGIMHACGHDGHTAIGLGTAEILMQLKDALHGTVKLIFQPAEEGVRGARSIVEQGHLDDVQYLLGAHITNASLGAPGAALIPGYDGGLATTKYDVTFRGQAAHAGACPEKGRHAILAAASAILNLYAIPRNAQGTSLVNVGTIHGGTGRNVVADTVSLEMEIRGETAQIHDYMQDYARRILQGAADMYGVTCEIRICGSAGPLTASRPLMDRIRQICEKKLHLNTDAAESLPGSGSEDVSYMMNRVQELGGQATFFCLLTPLSGPPHSCGFDFDEKVLTTGVKVFCAAALDLMTPPKPDQIPK